MSLVSLLSLIFSNKKLTGNKVWGGVSVILTLGPNLKAKSHDELNLIEDLSETYSVKHTFVYLCVCIYVLTL